MQITLRNFKITEKNEDKAGKLPTVYSGHCESMSLRLNVKLTPIIPNNSSHNSFEPYYRVTATDPNGIFSIVGTMSCLWNPESDSLYLNDGSFTLYDIIRVC